MRQKYEINIRRTFITPFHGGRILSVGNGNTAGHRQQSRCAPRGRHQHGGGGGKLACTVHRSARAAAGRVGRVIVTSGYRCQELNKAVGGVWNSQHLKGEAADIFVPDTATAMRYGHILERHSAVQQLLLEPMGIQQKRWIHVGFRRSE